MNRLRLFRRLPRPVLMCISLLLLSAKLHAQMPDNYSTVLADWHLCGIAEYRGEWSLARDTYRHLIEESITLPLTTREWYRGTAGYEVARCSARLNDSGQTRWGLIYAGEHHFWNYELVKLDSAMMRLVGVQLVDSLSKFWSTNRVAEQHNWRPQDAIVYTPTNYDRTDRWPLLIAMHGGNGNYESFATRWRYLADTLGAIIVVPPGILRESEITNSWGDNFEAIGNSIIAIVHNLTGRHLADSNQVYLTGFSQGGQATIELALRHPSIFRGGVAMSGFSSTNFSDSVLHVAQRYGTRLYAITGEFEDPAFHQQIETTAARCQQADIPFVLATEPGMIHEVPLDYVDRFIAAWHWLHSDVTASDSTAVSKSHS